MAEPTADASAPDEQPPGLVRTQDFEVTGPVELDLSNNHGSVNVELVEEAPERAEPVTGARTVHVDVRHDPAAAQNTWVGGLAGLLSWVTEQLGDNAIRDRAARERATREPVDEAVRQARIDLTGHRLVVAAPTTMPLRTIPLSITVQAPAGSQLGIRTAAGNTTVTGSAGRVRIQTGSGAVSIDRATATASVRSGSGAVHLGEMLGGVQARSGSGAVEITSIDGPSSIVTGSGDVWVGAARADLLVRSGSGSLTVAEAAAGQTELITGSGELRVAIREGVCADVDLTSTIGEVSSDLTVSDEPPEENPPLHVYGRTGSGNALITTSV